MSKESDGHTRRNFLGTLAALAVGAPIVRRCYNLTDEPVPTVEEVLAEPDDEEEESSSSSSSSPSSPSVCKFALS